MAGVGLGASVVAQLDGARHWPGSFKWLTTSSTLANEINAKRWNMVVLKPGVLLICSKRMQAAK